MTRTQSHQDQPFLGTEGSLLKSPLCEELKEETRRPGDVQVVGQSGGRVPQIVSPGGKCEQPRPGAPKVAVRAPVPLLLHQQTNVSPQISSRPLIANYLAAEAAAEQSFIETAHNVQGLCKRQQITKKEHELSQQSGVFPQ